MTRHDPLEWRSQYREEVRGSVLSLLAERARRLADPIPSHVDSSYNGPAIVVIYGATLNVRVEYWAASQTATLYANDAGGESVHADAVDVIVAFVRREALR